jgi:hypothetical protein
MSPSLDAHSGVGSIERTSGVRTGPVTVTLSIQSTSGSAGVSNVPGSSANLFEIEQIPA